jgi:[ribosomal protein S18]-alanine N-acetyltransferase
MIRLATIEDKIELDQLLSNFKTVSNFDRDYEKHLLYIKDGIISFLSYTKLYESIEIEYIYTKDEYKKMGYASELLKYLIDNNPGFNMTLEVNMNNQPAINLYGKMGFKIVANRERYYSGENAYLMHRKV